MNRKFTDMKICLCAKLLQSCPTLCDPMDCSQPGSSVHGFSRREYYSVLPCPLPGGPPDPGIERRSLTFPELAGRFFTTSTIREVHENLNTQLIYEK